MLQEKFREVAQQLGEYCPIKNELLIRKEKNTYHFICDEGEIRFIIPEQSEQIFYVANDVTIIELRRFIMKTMDTFDKIHILNPTSVNMLKHG